MYGIITYNNMYIYICTIHVCIYIYSIRYSEILWISRSYHSCIFRQSLLNFGTSQWPHAIKKPPSCTDAGRIKTKDIQISTNRALTAFLWHSTDNLNLSSSERCKSSEASLEILARHQKSIKHLSIISAQSSCSEGCCDVLLHLALLILEATRNSET